MNNLIFFTANQLNFVENIHFAPDFPSKIKWRTQNAKNASNYVSDANKNGRKCRFSVGDFHFAMKQEMNCVIHTEPTLSRDRDTTNAPRMARAIFVNAHSQEVFISALSSACCSQRHANRTFHRYQGSLHHSVRAVHSNTHTLDLRIIQCLLVSV